MLRLTASDRELEASRDVTVVVNGGPPVNLAPTVSAGNNQTIAFGEVAQLEGTRADDGLPAGSTLSSAWSKVSGPGTVTFGNAAQPATTASFSAAGTYVLRLTATDGTLSTSADVAIAVGVDGSANQPPVVSAGPNQAVSLPANTVTLSGSVTDDGLPLGAELTIAWQKVSGPGEATFSNPSGAITDVQLSAAGTYILRLTANDTQFLSWSETAVVVSAAAPANNPPTVVVSPSFELTLPSRTAVLNGGVSDDGRSSGATLDITWRQVSGPTGVVFANAKQAVTSVTLPNVAGTHVLSLTAGDSQLSTTATLVIRVNPVGVANLAPTVSAGPNLSVDMPATGVALNGTVEDDGLPEGVVPGAVWNQLSGPAEVTFADRYSPATTADFPLPGVYELELSATDAEYLSGALVVVTVVPKVDNHAPVVSVTGPGVVPLPPGRATFTGSIRDDGLPATGSLTVAWRQVSGPGSVTFSRPGSASTEATFSAPGAYVLELKASDSVLTSSAQLAVNVTQANQPPVVSAGESQTLPFPERVAIVSGTVTDDGLPQHGTISTEWIAVQAPVPVTFSEPDQLVTEVMFGYPGEYVLRLDANDGELTGSSLVSVIVAPASGPAPVAELTAPADGSSVTEPTEVTGTVSEGDWKLEYRAGGEDADPSQPWMTFATGTTPVTAGEFGTFDPTVLLNGTYAIRLTTSTSAGEVSDSLAVVVEKDLKVGNFTLAFSDLSVPVSGIPIEVARTYDSRDKAVGDFGVGWNVGVRTARVERSRVLGKSWEQTKSGGFLPQYCLRQTKPAFVTITLSDSKVYRFRVGTAPSCNVLLPIQTVDLTFTPEPGTKGSLVALDVDTLLVDGTLGPAELLDFDLEYGDAHRFQLTTDDGTVYIVSQKMGVESVEDPNGNWLTISRDGILHSSGKSVTFTRDSLGRISHITDPTGQAIHYEYDARGNLEAHVDRTGNRTTFAYNRRHDLIDIFDPNGNRPVRNEYDDSGRLVRHIDALGKVIEYTHDIAAGAEMITDRLGGVRVLEYDGDGNITSETDPEGHTVTRTFDARGNRTSETDADGNTTTYAYDAADNLVEQVDPLGNRTRHTYNSRHQELTTTDPLGNVTTNAYDGDGNRLSTTDPLGNTATYTYDGAGNRLTQTDALGNTTSYAYDGAGNRIQETDPLGNVTTYAYDANGNRVSEARMRTTTTGGQTLVTTYRYDSNGRLVETQDPDGTVTKTTYDGSGQETSTVDRLGRTTTMQYDQAGRLTSTQHPDGTGEQYEYDAEGRRVSSTDTCGRVTRYEYDAAGRLVKTTYPNGATQQHSYDAAGRLIASTDALGHVTQYEYDAARRRTRVIDALGNATTFGHDAAGNQVSVLDARGNTTTYEYDAANRRVRTNLPDGTSTALTYDAIGRKVAETDQAGKRTEFEYDAEGRLVAVIDALGQVTQYAYDELGNRISQVDANDHETAFEYDSAGRQTARILPDGKAETKSYDAEGNLSARVDFAGRTTTYHYDLANRLLEKRFPDSSAASLSYDCAGQRTSATDARGVTAYAYDPSGRLASMTYPDGRSLSYSYDLAGNRTALTAQIGASVLTASFGYDALNRMSTVSDPAGRVYSYSYDANGNRAGLVQPNGVETTYEYDGLNRLTHLDSVHEPSGLTVQSYAYTLGPTGIRTAIAELGGFPGATGTMTCTG